jgi:hypothetical protein
MVKLIRPLALFIMIAAMASSYHTQLVLFRLWEVDMFTAVIAPFAVDALAVICSIALGVKGASGKKLAATVLVLTLGASMAANFIAGVTLGSRIVHAGIVVLYLMAELVASRVQAPVVKAATVETTPVVEKPAEQTAVAEVKADDARAEDLPTAPVSPAPAGTGSRGPRGPYGGADDYSRRHKDRLKKAVK